MSKIRMFHKQFFNWSDITTYSVTVYIPIRNNFSWTEYTYCSATKNRLLSFVYYGEVGCKIKLRNR